MNYSETGKISVLMGIYNCADTLPDAIDSILNQSYSNWELIMCDDCSTDHTYDVASAYQKKYPDKIFLLKNDVNSKLAFTLNRCLSCATGKYSARMDGDDKCTPDRFQKQVDFLKANPDFVLCGTAMQRFYNDGSLGMIDAAPSEPDKFTLHRRSPFNHATIMMYTDVYRALNGYAVLPRTERGQDRDLWYRFFRAGYKGKNLSEPLYWVREDVEAIKRRTFHDRWIDFQTNLYGYKLLQYPKFWYPKLLIDLSKAFVPVKLVLLYRKIQGKKP